MKKPAMTATQVLAALRAGPFREPAHAWLYERFMDVAAALRALPPTEEP